MQLHPWSCRVCLLELKCVPLELRDIALDLQGVHPGAEVCALEMHCCRMGPLELKGAIPGATECAPGVKECALEADRCAPWNESVCPLEVQGVPLELTAPWN